MKQDEMRQTFVICRYAISKTIQSRLAGTAFMRVVMCSIFRPLNTAPMKNESARDRMTCSRYNEGSLRAVAISRFTSTEYCLQNDVPLNVSSTNRSGKVSAALAGESGACLLSGTKYSLPLESSMDPLLSTASKKFCNLRKRALLVKAPRSSEGIKNS